MINVGTWIVASALRTSTSMFMRRSAINALGLIVKRVARARSRTFGSEGDVPKRLANARSSATLLVTSASQLWVSVSYSSRVGAHGKSWARTKRGLPWNRMSAKTRSG